MEKIFFTEEKKANFSLFIRQMLIRTFFTSENGWGIFNEKLIWIY